MNKSMPTNLITNNIGQIFEIYQLPKLTQGETDNLNRLLLL